LDRKFRLREEGRSVRQAAERFSNVVKARPKSAAAWYGLGRSYQALSQKEFERLQKVAYGSAYWLALVAETNTKAGKYGSAFYLYHQAIAKRPDLSGIHAGLATIYSQTGHPDWAKLEQAQAARSPDCAREPLACAFAAGRYDKILRNPEDTPAALYWKCKAYDQLALRVLLHLASFPSSPLLHELLAVTHEKARDFPLAVQEWRKAYQLSGRDPQIGESLAMALIQIKDNPQAATLLETIIHNQPESAQANYLMGYTLLNLQKPSGAIPYLEKALRLDPTALETRVVLGEAYLQTGQSAKGIVQLKAALSLDQDGSLHYQLARAYLATGQRDLAERAIKQYRQMYQASQRESQRLKNEMQITAPEDVNVVGGEGATERR
jgi:predicted Zn-dependent protease